MAVYKVPQDVEAEDKLLGPFTFRQFIYLMITAMLGFITFQLFKSAPPIAFVTLFPTIIFGILGGYRRKDQPIETYLAALVRFFIVPRTRIWDQSGVESGVLITAPKSTRPVPVQRDEREVHGQLAQLSKLMDTRGWSSKRAELQLPVNQQTISHTERLVMPTVPQQEVIDVQAKDDVMDPMSSYVARNMGELAQKSHDAQLQHARQIIQDAQKQRDEGGPDPNAHLGHKVVQPLNADILGRVNGELNVQQMAQQAQRMNQRPPDNQVG